MRNPTDIKLCVCASLILHWPFWILFLCFLLFIISTDLCTWLYYIHVFVCSLWLQIIFLAVLFDGKHCWKCTWLQQLARMINSYSFFHLCRLREMLRQEEKEYLAAMEAAEETTLERQAKMRERARSLKEKREQERLQFVQDKYDQQFRWVCWTKLGKSVHLPTHTQLLVTLWKALCQASLAHLQFAITSGWRFSSVHWLPGLACFW